MIDHNSDNETGFIDVYGWKLLLVTGVCGGHTTFSSFLNEGFTLFKEGHYPYFFAYTLGSFLLGILVTFAGWLIAK